MSASGPTLYARSTVSFLRRSVGTLAQWIATLTFVPFVFPTYALGQDYADDERASFWRAITLGNVAGQAGFAQLLAVDGDLLVEGAWITGGSADPVTIIVTIAPYGGAPGPVVTTGYQSGPGPQRAVVAFGTAPAPGNPAEFAADANVTLELPVHGIILHQGYALQLNSLDNNRGFRCGFRWRNIGGPTGG